MSTAESSSIPHAELLSYRREFPILERCTYLINNSLGAMPRSAETELLSYTQAWSERGVRAWSEGWWEMPVTTGDLLAPLLGVSPGTIAMHTNVTLATAVFLSCLDYPRDRNRIVYTELEFPSLMYLCEGERARGAEIVVVPSEDGLTIDEDRLRAAIDPRTRVAIVSHVMFKSAYMVDAEALARHCREVGAYLLLDVYQSVGCVPLALEQWGVDAAVGGSVKWLCGGPGAAFLYVRPELAEQLHPRLTGWQADDAPFAFRPGAIRHARGAWRFLTGTPSIPALYACRAGYRMIHEVGPARIRERSLALTQRLMDAAEAAGFTVKTPRSPEHRGGTVAVWHPAAEALCHALIEDGVLCDYRPGAGIRLAPHFYNTAAECDRAIDLMARRAQEISI